MCAYDATYIAAADLPLIERLRGKHPSVLSLSDALPQRSLPLAIE